LPRVSAGRRSGRVYPRVPAAAVPRASLGAYVLYSNPTPRPSPSCKRLRKEVIPREAGFSILGRQLCSLAVCREDKGAWHFFPGYHYCSAFILVGNSASIFAVMQTKRFRRPVWWCIWPRIRDSDETGWIRAALAVHEGQIFAKICSIIVRDRKRCPEHCACFRHSAANASICFSSLHLL